MKIRFSSVGVLASLILPTWSVAAGGSALLNRTHVGRVKAVDPSASSLFVEGMFHDKLFRQIPVALEPEAAIINPDVMDRTRSVTRGDIRPGYYVALECTETGRRHAAWRVTITSTTEEEGLQRALMQAGRAAPPGLRATGGSPR